MLRPPALACLLPLVLAAPALAGPRIGIEGGLNSGMLTYSSNFFDFNPGYQAAWSFGLTLEAPTGSHFSLVSGARYIEYGEKMGIQVTDQTGATLLDMHVHNVYRFVSMPVLLRYRPFARQGFFLTIGSDFSYLADVAQQFDDTPAYALTVPGIRAARAAQIFEDVGTFKSIDAFDRWNVSATGGLGWEFPLGSHRALGQVRYTHGLTDIAKSSDVERTTRGFESLLGLTW